MAAGREYEGVIRVATPTRKVSEVSCAIELCWQMLEMKGESRGMIKKG